MNNEDKKIYEIVNQYYYDIESSKIYFGIFKVWKLRGDRLLVYASLIVYFFLAALNILVIFLNAFKLLNKNTYIYAYASSYMIWIVYISCLLIYFGYCLYMEKQKLGILKKSYNKDKLIDIQKMWIQNNLPSNINKKILIDKMVQWENTHKILESYSNEFHTTGKFFQSSHFNTLFKVILSVFPLIISVNILNGISIEEFSAENPMIYLTLIVYLIIVIEVLVFTYSLLRPSLERLLCHIDGNRSKRAYRFNIFNRMISNHVTIKELNES